MKKHGLWTITLAVLTVVMLTGCVSKRNAEEPFAEKATGLVFPASIGSLVFTGVHEYEDPSEGLDVRYSGDGIAATIYVYSAGLDRVPDGVDDPVHAEAMTQIANDIAEVGRQGVYQDVALGQDEVVGLAGEGRGLKARHVLATYAFDGSKWHSHAYLLGYRGRFIKLRYSFRDEFTADGEAQLTNLLGWLDGAMGGLKR